MRGLDLRRCGIKVSAHHGSPYFSKEKQAAVISFDLYPSPPPRTHAIDSNQREPGFEKKNRRVVPKQHDDLKSHQSPLLHLRSDGWLHRRSTIATVAPSTHHSLPSTTLWLWPSCPILVHFNSRNCRGWRWCGTSVAATKAASTRSIIPQDHRRSPDTINAVVMVVSIASIIVVNENKGMERATNPRRVSLPLRIVRIDTGGGGGIDRRPHQRISPSGSDCPVEQHRKFTAGTGP